MLAFARKPAPVQVTYLAYAGTTGLDAIDCRLSDPHLDPPGEDESDYSEKTVRLPQTYWCYPPPAEAPDVGPLPARRADHITFGCLNNYAKVTSQTLQAWCALLRRVPNSTLIVHSQLGSHRRNAHEQLSAAGIDPARISFVHMSPFAQYLRQYDRIDIALDPFPYPGGTTTCDALWMGVPVITLAGQTAVSRGGKSILTNLGLTDMIATSVEQYVDIAAQLATDMPRLESLRQSLRTRMRSSPLMYAPQFARDVESAFRRMWCTWCG